MHYEAADTHVRVRFDLGIESGWQLQHMNVYLMHNGQQIAQDLRLIPEFSGRLYADIPLENIAAQLPLSGRADVQIKIAAWFQNTISSSQLHTAGNVSSLIEVPVSNVMDNDLEGIPENNAYLVQYLRDHVLPTLHQVSDTEWVADETSGMQCKEWVQHIVREAFLAINKSITLPSNPQYLTSVWNVSDSSNVFENGRITIKDELNVYASISDLQNFFISLSPGDMIQFITETDIGQTPHTMIIDAITNTGIRVFDSNWSTNLDETVRMREITYEKIYEKGVRFTSYRIKS